MSQSRRSNPGRRIPNRTKSQPIKSDATEYTAGVLLERCPICDAGPGGWCTVLDDPTRPRTRPHPARVRLARPGR